MSRYTADALMEISARWVRVAEGTEDPESSRALAMAAHYATIAQAQASLDLVDVMADLAHVLRTR